MLPDWGLINSIPEIEVRRYYIRPPRAAHQPDLGSRSGQSAMAMSYPGVSCGVM